MRVIDRYLMRETSLTLAAVTIVLFLMIAGRLFVRLLSRATEGKVPVDVVLPLLGFGSLKAIILLLPVGLLIAIMLTMGRLYRDSEMAALRACGVGNRQLYKPLLMLALPIALLLSALAMYVAPWSIQRTDQITADARERMDLRGLSAGRFVASSAGNLTLFVESIDADGQQVQNVFVHSFEDGVAGIETARRAEQHIDPDTGERSLILSDGHRYEGRPGEASFRILAYRKHALRVPELDTGAQHLARDALPTALLWGSKERSHIAELQWRVSIPLSAIIVVLLAVPLSYSTPRQGRFSKVVVAILVYIVYANLTIVAVKWIERGVISAWLGVWWVHFCMLAFAAVLLLKQRRMTPMFSAT